MLTLSIKQHFDAAHSLESYEGNCSRLHGHRWDIIFKVTGTLDGEKNMIVDFAKVKAVLKDLLPDHQHLNTFYDEPNPTAEFLAGRLYYGIQPALLDIGAKLLSVEVFESPECSALYSEE